MRHGGVMPRRVVERMQAKLGVTWRAETVGTFKAGNPDAVVRGIATRIVTIPEMTFNAAARLAQERFAVKALRVIGEPATKVTTVGYMPGFGQLAGLMRMLADADLVFTGEQREWEGLYYAHDLVSSGRPKGVIVLGHAVSEEPGMQICAEWLKTFITEVPIELIPAGEPFWRPVG